MATARYVEDSLQQAVDGILMEMSPEKVDLLLLFVSPQYSDQFELIPGYLLEIFPNARLIGCSAAGVIGDGQEIEHERALSLTAAELPGVDLDPMFIDTMDLPDGDDSPDAWMNFFKTPPEVDPHFIVLADPFTCRSEKLLEGLDYCYPNGVKIGGLASGAGRMNENVLFMDHTIYYQGCVVLSMSGNIKLDTLVAQGCRPIGEMLAVTKSEDNMVMELDGEPPLTYIRNLAATLSSKDQELIKNSLFIGIEKDFFTDDPGYGDFLIRNIIGVNTDDEALVLNAEVERGQMVQFYLRDQSTSSEDLNTILSDYSASDDYTHVQGALLFSCLGRGSTLYGEPNHDSNMFLEKMGLPVSGFFCSGEIGPIGQTTYLHGYTSAFAMIREKAGINAGIITG